MNRIAPAVRHSESNRHEPVVPVDLPSRPAAPVYRLHHRSASGVAPGFVLGVAAAALLAWAPAGGIPAALVGASAIALVAIGASAGGWAGILAATLAVPAFVPSFAGPVAIATALVLQAAWGIANLHARGAVRDLARPWCGFSVPLALAAIAAAAQTTLG